MSNLPIQPQPAEAATSLPMPPHPEIAPPAAEPHGYGRVRMLACLGTHADWVLGRRQPEDHDVAQGARFGLRAERAGYLPGAAQQGQEVGLDVRNDSGLRWNAASAAASIEARFTALFGEITPGHAAGREHGLPRAAAWRRAHRVAAESMQSSNRADRNSGDQTQAIDTTIGIPARCRQTGGKMKPGRQK